MLSFVFNHYPTPWIHRQDPRPLWKAERSFASGGLGLDRGKLLGVNQYLWSKNTQACYPYKSPYNVTNKCIACQQYVVLPEAYLKMLGDAGGHAEVICKGAWSARLTFLEALNWTVLPAACYAGAHSFCGTRVASHNTDMDGNGRIRDLFKIAGHG